MLIKFSMTCLMYKVIRVILAIGMLVLGSVEMAYAETEGSPPYRGPIIDVHLHAFPINVQGPPPVGVCVGEAANLGFDASTPWSHALLNLMKKPRCDSPIWSPKTDTELREQTIAEIKRLNITAVVSGPPELVKEYQALAPDRIIPGLLFNLTQTKYTPEDVKKLFDEKDFKVFGEVTDQYDGIAPDDLRLDPFWKFAAERDVPVAVHIGIGPPGASYLSPKFRARLHSPMSLEEVLVRYPNMRLYIMHAAWPMLDELKALLYTHPQVYVDTGTLQMALTRVEYYDFLKNLVNAGFTDRIMYGTDQIVWPGLIEEGINAINDAPFLTMEQKKAILHDNAARFLRLIDNQAAVACRTRFCRLSSST